MPNAMELQKVYADQVKAAFENNSVRPVKAHCEETHVVVELADGREIRAPLWWYPFLQKASLKERNKVELMFEGVWWPVMDEGISVKSMLLGWRMTKATNRKMTAYAAKKRISSIPTSRTSK